jgi:hypothetical protein
VTATPAFVLAHVGVRRAAGVDKSQRAAHPVELAAVLTHWYLAHTKVESPALQRLAQAPRQLRAQSSALIQRHLVAVKVQRARGIELGATMPIWSHIKARGNKQAPIGVQQREQGPLLFAPRRAEWFVQLTPQRNHRLLHGVFVTQRLV